MIFLIKYLVVGGVGVALNFLGFMVLYDFFGFSILFSVLWMHIIILLVTFILQRRFTFQSQLPVNLVLKKFLITDLMYVGSDYALTAIFISLLNFTPWIGKASCLAILTPLSFLMQRFWVFK